MAGAAVSTLVEPMTSMKNAKHKSDSAAHGRSFRTALDGFTGVWSGTRPAGSPQRASYLLAASGYV